jgi:Fibronectin type III domain
MTESATQEGLLVRMVSHRRQIQLAILALVAALLLVGLAVQAEAQEIAAQSGTSDTGSTATASDTNVKVMVLIYNPVIESQGNRRLTAVKGWNSPDALTTQLIQDLRVASHDNAKYEVVKRVELDEWVPCENGRRYTDELYLQEAAAGKFTLCPGSEQSIMADYKRIIQENDIAGAVNRGEIDEVFMWAYPGAGFWESAMAGDNAFYINGGPIQGVPGKPFILMGFNYERTVDLALHSYGHRTERIMERVYGRWSRFTEGNDWERFTLLHRDVPGRGGLGNVHSAFNGRPPDNPEDETRWGRWARNDYDNQAFASTSADDWYNFPHMTGQRTIKNCTAWSCNQHGYLKWWFDHMPHVAGVKNGVLNNWWAYILDPSFVLNPRLPPVPPSNLTASASGSDRVRLTWQDNSSNENGFWIYTDDNYTPPNPPANATSTEVTGLQADTRYCFKVEAYNNNGDPDRARRRAPRRVMFLLPLTTTSAVPNRCLALRRQSPAPTQVLPRRPASPTTRATPVGSRCGTGGFPRPAGPPP